MTRYSPLWQQANAYPAALDRSLIQTLFPRGGATGAVPAAVANAMQISIPPGTLAVPLQAGQGTALCIWDAPELVPIALPAPPAGQTRIDVVIAQVRDNAIDGGPFNDFVFQALQGVPAAAAPAVPATPANALALVNVTVPAQAANLNGATIADQRLPLSIPTGQVRAMVWRTAGFALAVGATVINFNNARSDPLGMLQAGSIRVPFAGVYAVSWATTQSGGASGGFVQPSLTVNGATRHSAPAIAAAGITPLSSGSAILVLNAGDVLGVSHWNGTNGAGTTNGGEPNNYLHTQLLAWT